MKRLATILMIGLLATMNTQAINLLQGSREVGVSGLIDFDTADGTLISLDVAYGVFWADFVQSGVRAGISDSSSISTWRLGVYSEYNFFYNSPLVPYVGGSIDVLGSELDLAGDDSNEAAAGLGLDLGVKYFLTDAIAISTQLGFDVATADVFPAEDGAEDVNWDLTLGLRFHF